MPTAGHRLTAPRVEIVFVGMGIRPLLPLEMEEALALYERAGAGDRRALATFLLEHPDAALLALEGEGAVVGAVGAIACGQTSGWVGSLVADPALQEVGSAQQLLATACDWLDDRGVPTVLILADDRVRPLCERLGFQAEGEYAVLAGPGRQGPVPHGVRPLRRDDLKAVLTLDREATGEDRSAIIRALPPEGWVAAGQDGRPRGYHLRCPWGQGPIVSISVMGGFSLMGAVRTGTAGTVRVMLPVANRTALDHLKSGGFAGLRRVTRMRRGPGLPWRPEAIFGAFNPHWG